MRVEINKKEMFDDKYIDSIKHISEFTEEELKIELEKREEAKRYRLVDYYTLYDSKEVLYVELELEHIANGGELDQDFTKEYIQKLLKKLNSKD